MRKTNALQQMIINEAIDLHEKQFSDWVSIEEYRLCLESQYLPIEFLDWVWETDEPYDVEIRSVL